MTRGIELPIAKKLLINGFLNEIFENIPEEKIKEFLRKKYKGTNRWDLAILNHNFQFLNKK